MTSPKHHRIEDASSRMPNSAGNQPGIKRRGKQKSRTTTHVSIHDLSHSYRTVDGVDGGDKGDRAWILGGIDIKPE